LLEDSRQVSAALSRSDRGDVHRRENPLGGQSLGEQRAFAHSLANILQQRSQALGGRALGQQIEGLQNRQTSFYQSVKLLVEYQEIMNL